MVVKLCAGEVQTDASGTKTVWAILEDGRRFEGDILIGADGIWSKVGLSLLTILVMKTMVYILRRF